MLSGYSVALIPVELPLGEHSLFVRGRIDRIDVEGLRTLVRDLKTGRAHPRIGKAKDPDPGLDVQIAIYGLVAQTLADEWKIPKQVAVAYAYIGRSGAVERVYGKDFHTVLEPAARHWLAVAAGLLAGRQFPRTPNADDCTYCCFRPVCGETGYARAAALLADADGVLVDFGALKGLDLQDEVDLLMRRIRKPAPDQAQRDAAVAEHHRNVLVDAGAGTGKTTILVDRLVEMLAPLGTQAAVPISRIAAITFTRKAAGDLRLRIRERLLNELADVRPGSQREAQLRDALAGLDTAYVGTIHGFADRLLRLRPVEADLSPSYEIAEDQGPLVRETLQVLLQAVESGTLVAELIGANAAARADEATRTILDALAAGLQVESRETEWKVYYGLDALVEGFIRQRDIPPPDVPALPFDFTAFGVAADEFIQHSQFSTRGFPRGRLDR